MKKISLMLLCIYMVQATSAQQDSLAVKYAKLITPELAKKTLDLIASDAYEGRETGMPGADKAANYIAAAFKSQKLQTIAGSSYFFRVPLEQKTTHITLAAGGNNFVYGDDVYDYGHAANGVTSAGEVIFVGYGTDEEVKGTDLKGKVLLWIDEDKSDAGIKANNGSTPTAARKAVLEKLLAKNPAVILGINPEIGGLLKHFGAQFKRPTVDIKDGDKPAAHVAILFISSVAANAILKPADKSVDSLISLAAKGHFTARPLKADFKLAVQADIKDLNASDVLGYLPGNDPMLKDEVLIISAHYDHLGILPEGTKGDRVYNGADDDGSGITAIIEIAKAFAEAQKTGHGPRRSILFLATVGEEEGLLGSKYYADHPIIPLTHTIADLNMDMIGRVGAEYKGKPDSANYIYVIGSPALIDTANQTYINIHLDYKYNDLNDSNHFYYRFDSYSFAAHGVPAITYFNGIHADYHQLSDEVSRINFPLLVKRVQLVYYTAWILANADTRPASQY